MVSIKNITHATTKDIKKALSRFPLTILALLIFAGLTSYSIEVDWAITNDFTQALYTSGIAALLGVAAQIAAERFQTKKPYAVAILLTLMYYIWIRLSGEITPGILAKTFVLSVAIVAVGLFLPAYRDKVSFYKMAYVHMVSALRAFLYALVLFLGLMLILYAFSTLLYSLNSRVYLHVGNLVWSLFLPVYYLSLLPSFHPDGEEELTAFEKRSRMLPAFDVLLSYIVVPLFIIYTLILIFYIIKIIVTRVWPIGLIGPMVLGYSIVGLLIYVLAFSSQKAASVQFRTWFPKIWIPIILVQFVSIGIRLQAYGFTVSRYYVFLFAIFSLLSAVLLCIGPVKHMKTAALVAAVLAVASLVPPVDATSVSNRSQIARIEAYLTEANMLRDNQLIANPDASEETKREVTSILNYLIAQKVSSQLPWLPDNFELYAMRESFGFDPTYIGLSGTENHAFYITLDNPAQSQVKGYDVLTDLMVQRMPPMSPEEKEMIEKPGSGASRSETSRPVLLNGKHYTVAADRNGYMGVELVLLEEEAEVLRLDMKPLSDALIADKNTPATLGESELSLEKQEGRYKMKATFVSLNGERDGAYQGVDFQLRVLYAVGDE